MRNRIGSEACALQSAGKSRLAARTRRRGAFLRLWVGENGQSLAETALTLPILAMVILGIFQCGILFNNYIQLTNAAGAGADYLQTLDGSTTITDPCAATFTAVANAAPTLKSSNITVKVILNDTNSTTATASTYTGTGSGSGGLTCSGELSQLVRQAPAVVTVSYPASLVIYGKNFFSSTATISQTVTVYEY
jgi:Flp pilus assembly protein TadG